jgi:DNA helicase-2/ATP-dependent DNA helicase PcrA
VLEADRSHESIGRQENVATLIGQASEYDNAAAFLEQISLVAEVQEADPDESSVSIMTLHSAKGLEFPVVFLIGLEDGVFPLGRTVDEPDEMEEERRLCYVGITRARERLYLTNALSRQLWGSWQHMPPSRFLKEIPDEFVEHAPGSHPYQRSVVPGQRRHDIVEAAIRAGRNPATPVRTSGAENLGLKIGDDVVHGKWGEGVVLELTGSGDKAEVVVRFPSVGEKRLLLAWAPIKKA